VELKVGFPFLSIIWPEQMRKRHLARLRIAPWTGPTWEPLYHNTRAGRREEYYNRPIVQCVVPSNDPVIPPLSPEQLAINHQPILSQIRRIWPSATNLFPDAGWDSRIRECRESLGLAVMESWWWWRWLAAGASSCPQTPSTQSAWFRAKKGVAI
jgi:hypothetical protein